MKEVALYNARNTLSALVAEVERTGEEVVITRHGKPVARLAPARVQRTPEERAALLRSLIAKRDAMAAEHPETAAPLSWEELKADMHPDD
jgi:prevent-host-death family protein